MYVTASQPYATVSTWVDDACGVISYTQRHKRTDFCSFMNRHFYDIFKLSCDEPVVIGGKK